MKDIPPAFCVHPWVNLMVNTTSTYNFCCVTDKCDLKDDNGNILTANKNTPHEAWNSKTIRDVRKAMLNGEKLSICKRCWLQESIGKESYREKHNREWIFGRLGEKEVDRRVQETIDNDYFLNSSPTYLDLRLGNICNLKCRMCNVWNSNQIEKEHLTLIKNNSYVDIWTRSNNRSVHVQKPDQDWLYAEKFWNILNEYIPNLKKVYFTGGEPTLIERNYEFMREIIKHGYQDKISIMFNTNCTNIQQRWLDVISEFTNVQVNASIDGVGAVNDYIRAPSHWESIYKNFCKIASMLNVNVDVSPVIQIYNIFDIGEILKFAQHVSRKVGKIIDVDFLFCTEPSYFDPINLSEGIRDLAFIKLQKWQHSWLYDNSQVTKNSIDSYLKFLESNRDKNWKQNMEDFWNMTSVYDKTRKQSFQQSIPTLYEALHAEK